ncbi:MULTISPECIES: hypothetical protein [Kamptonema]|uniref:hypothetical protein n=1 Tax=Kamptonema TaxID=1501433 RepID=UPI0001DAC54A|nr:MULTISPECIES: hypothetical protein [Kamptonema]CBN55460.1 hypothetical protein OSCI_1960003 [Kamptonema sp. PCC 6506]
MNHHNTKPAPLELLAKLADHPHGLELANLVDRLYQEAQLDTQADPRQVAIALQQAKSQGIEDIPYFKPLVTRIQNLVTWVQNLVTRVQNLEERQLFIESELHHENCHLKDELSQYKSKPDESSEDD